MLFVLIPLAVLVVFAAAAMTVLVFIKTARTTIKQTAAGQAIDIEGRYGTVKLLPKSQLDPELAAILVYPGALRGEPATGEYQLDLSFFSTKRRILTASYWTPDPLQRVWEFYQRELPQWKENPIDGARYELVENGRKIHVYRKGDRTVIDTSLFS